MWDGQVVSVILPTYNEKDSIRACIQAFLATGYVDEVLVVNNNAAPGTSEEVAGTGAVEVFEQRQGYGWACRRGLAEAKGDLLLICEPDDTFDPRDTTKLLAYSDDFPYVLGTRTTREFIWDGANMGRFLRWGNWAVAKQVEFLFNTPTLTDVGCTFRLLHRETYLRVREAFAVGDSHFGPHLTLLVILAGIPFTEISVNYRARMGESMVTGSFPKAVRLGLRMIGMVTSTRLGSWGGRIDRTRLIPYPEPIPPERAAQRLV
ncbi:MAG: glycosyltransferase family 2 protein [Planctomycetota bacterium]